MFNHSCSPNLIHIFDGIKVYLVAARTIEANEELCIAYKSFTTENTRQRRAILRKDWNFRCNCERCLYADDVNNEPHNEITQADINIATCVRTNRISCFADLEKDLKKEYNSYGHLEWDPFIGTQGMAYKKAIVDHLNG